MRAVKKDFKTITSLAIGILFTTTITVANEESIEIDCSMPKNPSDIEECYQSYKDGQSKIVKVTNIDQYRILTWHSTLYWKIEALENTIEKESPINLAKAIFGKQSTLNTIISIAVSTNNQEIAILNKTTKSTKEILIFPLDVSGEIKPFRIITSSKILGMERIIYSDDDKDIVVVNDQSKEAISFDINANSLSFKEELKPRPKNSRYQDFALE